MNRFFCFATENTPYVKIAEDCCTSSFREFGIHVVLMKLASHNDWMRNCMARAGILNSLAIQNPLDNIGLLDADVTCLKEPVLLNEFVGDVAVLDNGEKAMPGWRYSAGVLLFGTSPKARNCLWCWQELCRKDEKHFWELREQVYLKEAIEQSGVAVTNIGERYNRHIDKYVKDDDTVILHHVASRQLRKAIGGRM